MGGRGHAVNTRRRPAQQPTTVGARALDEAVSEKLLAADAKPLLLVLHTQGGQKTPSEEE